MKNEQVEQDLKANGKTPDANETYHGAQDTGDRDVRQQGTDVQKADGRPAGEESGES